MIDLLRRLSERERVLVIAAALFISGSILYGFIVDPLLASQRRYEDLARREREDLARFRMLAMDYRKMDSSMKSLENRVSAGTSGTSLLAAMEAEARKLGLGNRIASMKPTSSDLDSGMVETSVEMRIEKVNLGEVVELLGAIEGGTLTARTGRLRMKTRFDDPQLLDVTLLVTALETR